MSQYIVFTVFALCHVLKLPQDSGLYTLISVSLKKKSRKKEKRGSEKMSISDGNRALPAAQQEPVAPYWPPG